MKILAKLSRIDLITLAYNSVGILNSENIYESGEYHVIKNILPKHFVNVEKPILFDVGANIGQYSLLLRKKFPSATIYSFEPNSYSFTALRNNSVGYENLCYNIGFGARKKETKLFTYDGEKESEHSSVYKEVFSNIHKTEDRNLLEVNIVIDTLDNFCADNNIPVIDFLKIDTEGYEYEVLLGALNLIKNGKVKIIQFEFNEMNVFSKVFFKDFYDLLSNYSLFRLRPTNLLPIKNYDPMLEIFKFQNILAIRNTDK